MTPITRLLNSAIACPLIKCSSIKCTVTAAYLDIEYIIQQQSASATVNDK